MQVFCEAAVESTGKALRYGSGQPILWSAWRFGSEQPFFDVVPVQSTG